jgi:hypothetical protein
MSFREKSACVSFVLLLLMSSVYFWLVIRMVNGRLDPGSVLWIAHDVLVAFVVLQIVLHAIIVIAAPREARTPKDERERLIELKATRIAFFVLVIGALASLWASHFPGLGFRAMGHGVVSAILIAWLVKLGGQILFYRRGV